MKAHIEHMHNYHSKAKKEVQIGQRSNNNKDKLKLPHSSKIICTNKISTTEDQSSSEVLRKVVEGYSDNIDIQLGLGGNQCSSQDIICQNATCLSSPHRGHIFQFEVFSLLNMI